MAHEVRLEATKMREGLPTTWVFASMRLRPSVHQFVTVENIQPLEGLVAAWVLTNVQWLYLMAKLVPV